MIERDVRNIYRAFAIYILLAAMLGVIVGMALLSDGQGWWSLIGFIGWPAVAIAIVAGLIRRMRS